MEDFKLLKIYLQDHLAGSIAGLELARRTASNNPGTALSAYLERFVREIEEEQGAVERLLDAIDATPDRLKQLAAWVAEKAGRLKMNGQITGYSDLSRLVELEGLCLGVEGKLSLWKSLKQVEGHHSFLAVTDLDELAQKAQSQREELEMHRLEAARIALGPPV